MTAIDAQINYVLSTVCEGCLTADRHTSLLENGDTKTLFYEMINDFGTFNNSFLLCWECRAILKKIILFRRQVKTAHQQLITSLVQPTKLTSLTRLSTTKTQTVDIVPTNPTNNSPTNTDMQSVPTTATTSNKNEPIDSYNSQTNSDINKNEHCLHTNLANDKKGLPTINKDVGPTIWPINNLIQNQDLEGANKPVTFVKVEDTMHSEEFEEVYLDDVDRDSLGDDKELTGDHVHCSHKKTNNRKTEEEFNESDDEPLNTKKSGRGIKHRGKRKLVKRVRTKREKQPGVVVNARIEKKLQQLNVTSDQVEMVVLSWEEVEADRQQALMSARFTRHEHRCQDCVLGFNHRAKLELHMTKHRASLGDQECSICKVRCRDAQALSAHLRRHRVRWRCVSCGSLWSRAGVAADHVARAHSAAAPTHNCSLCGHCATSLSKLRIHMKTHGERQQCELCHKTFRDKTALKTHLFIHRGEKEYACPRCDKRFLFKKAMELHLVTHDAPAHLYCHMCDMNFKNKMSFYQHMKYNLKHIDPAKLKYACSLCEKRFVKAARLAEHNLAVHLKATPVRCPESGCDFACSTRPVLRTHLRMVHRNGRALRNHVCDVCGKAYTTKKTLEGHLRSHSGERPFQCPLCPSTFGYEAALYNHNKLVHLKAKSGRSRLPESNGSTAWTLPGNEPATLT